MFVIKYTFKNKFDISWTIKKNRSIKIIWKLSNFLILLNNGILSNFDFHD